MKPKIILLCGSSKFIQVMAVCAWFLERDEHAIVMGLHLLPWWYTDVTDHLAEAEGVAAGMDELHRKKIDLVDEIFVVCPHGYVGESTRREIEYAQERGISIRRYDFDPMGQKVEAFIQARIKALHDSHIQCSVAGVQII
jgi:hypothetical protein